MKAMHGLSLLIRQSVGSGSPKQRQTPVPLQRLCQARAPLLAGWAPSATVFQRRYRRLLGSDRIGVWKSRRRTTAALTIATRRVAYADPARACQSPLSDT